MNYRLTVPPPFELTENRQTWEIRIYCEYHVHWLLQVEAGAPANAPGIVLYTSHDEATLIEDLMQFGTNHLHPSPQLMFEQMVHQGKAERLPLAVQGPSCRLAQQLQDRNGSRMIFGWSRSEGCYASRQHQS